MEDSLPFMVVSLLLILLSVWLLVRGLKDPNRKRGLSWAAAAIALLCFAQPEISFGLNGFDDPLVMKLLGLARVLLGAGIITCICLSLGTRAETQYSRSWNIVRHVLSTLAACSFLMVGYGELRLITIDTRQEAGRAFTLNDGVNGFEAYGKDYVVKQSEHGLSAFHRPIPLLIELNSIEFDLVNWDKFRDDYLESYVHRSDISNFRIRENSSSTISSEFQSMRKDGMVGIFDKVITDRKHNRLIQTTITTINKSYSIMVRNTIDRFNASMVARIESTLH